MKWPLQIYKKLVQVSIYVDMLLFVLQGFQTPSYIFESDGANCLWETLNNSKQYLQLKWDPETTVHHQLHLLEWRQPEERT